MASARMLAGGRARVHFRLAGRQYTRTFRVASAREAGRIVAAIDETLQDIERGKLTVPVAGDAAMVKAFVFSGGKTADRVGAPTRPAEPRAKPPTIAEVFARYVAGLTPDSKQPSSLATEKVHRDRLALVLGADSPLAAVDLAAAQAYVDRRARDGVVRDTMAKELATLLVIWKWACKRGLVAAMPAWARRDLTFPKGSERPPFQTWAQVERRVRVERLEGAAAAAAWDSLWLDTAQTVACLAWVAEHARHPFLPPMFAFAAYTGARRSEILRSERLDWDFEGGEVVVRQKKADTARHFTRRTVPIHPDLAATMQAWFLACPDSRWTVSTADGRPIGPRMATKYFRAATRGGPYEVLPGWHTFRHSLASNMASAGVDQRVISEILGHHTENMERRYRHLLPERKDHAIRSLF